MKYQRKSLPTVTVVTQTFDTKDLDGVVVRGVTVYINEFGAKCVISTTHFLEMYEIIGE